MSTTIVREFDDETYGHCGNCGTDGNAPPKHTKYSLVSSSWNGVNLFDLLLRGVRHVGDDGGCSRGSGWEHCRTKEVSGDCGTSTGVLTRGAVVAWLRGGSVDGELWSLRDIHVSIREGRER